MKDPRVTPHPRYIRTVLMYSCRNFRMTGRSEFFDPFEEKSAERATDE